MNKIIGKKKIAVALSGGIDSSVAAALLKKERHDLIGIFIRLWTEAGLKKMQNAAEQRAEKVAKKLGIPFFVLSLEKEFKKIIVDYFLSEEKKGRTPNPCVVCNKEIKFGLLLKQALKLRTDYLATGHYARLKREFPNSKSQISNIKLLRGNDKNKDQSYFLWMLNQNQLKRILFPIGDYTRNEVEKLAKKFKLPLSGVKKSREICFIDKNTKTFLKKYLKNKPGLIINHENKILGQHQGVHFYTIGQRKGIKLSGGPYYVSEKNLRKNNLIVSKKEKNLLKKEIAVRKINWQQGKEPQLPLDVKVKIRSVGQPGRALIMKEGKSAYIIRFNRLQRAATPGQSAVFYKGEELLGGGIIS